MDTVGGRHNEDTQAAGLAAMPHTEQAPDICELVSSAELDMVAHLTAALALRMRWFARQNPESSELDEALRMLTDASAGIDYFVKEQNKSYVPHAHDCHCDSCAAEASDIAYDRKRDSALMRA